MDRAPSQSPPQTIWLVERCTDRKIFAEGVKRAGSSGSSVMVGRKVAVDVGRGVLLASTSTVPAAGVVVGSSVLRTNRSGVNVGSRANGVAVGCGGEVGVGLLRKGSETGSPLQLERSKKMARAKMDDFIIPLR